MTKDEWDEAFSDGFREGVRYAMSELASLYDLDDIEDTDLWSEFVGDDDECELHDQCEYCS